MRFLALSLTFCCVAYADDRRTEQRHVEERRAPPRPQPPKWQPHPQGVHPHGAIIRQHPTRVVAPRVVVRGNHPWAHWEHPEFSRPAYYWDWAAVHQVTCVAEDSYGDQYPVTQQGWAGFALGDMSGIEDEALDRCYQESGGDTSCVLLTCSHI